MDGYATMAVTDPKMVHDSPACETSVEDILTQVLTRIDELSTDILNCRRDSELVKQLQQSKSATQRQLNAIRDPIARFPLEISSEIFRQSLPSLPERFRICTIPNLLLNVCSTWTDIAVSNPALWARIVVEPNAPLRLLESGLERAGNHP
ncbi:hypothetical protein DFH06DRAFT_471121 [Mycena polygramma]|nr:hypothetical protein DFH06DRAFT_471121 [Mycena polygramma]